MEFLEEFLREKMNSYPFTIRIYNKCNRDTYCILETVGSIYCFKNGRKIKFDKNCIYDRAKHHSIYYNVVYGESTKNKILDEKAELIMVKFNFIERLRYKLLSLTYDIKRLGWSMWF